MDGEIELDIHRIEQILDNLFENALRFTPSGGAITLTWAWVFMSVKRW
jgi:signal transduction histidine kinase